MYAEPHLMAYTNAAMKIHAESNTEKGEPCSCPPPPPLAASCYPIPVLHTPYVGPPWLTYVMPMANTVKEVWGFYTERTCRICRILAGLL